MKRSHLLSTITIVCVACGGGDASDTGSPNTGATSQPVATAPAMPAAPTGPLAIPDWYTIDNDARTVHMTINYGETPDNNYWNMNGAIKGAWTITVPEGYTITIDQVNQDPNMAHSLGIQADFTNPMVPPMPNPVFEGAITPNPQSMIEATMPGETGTVQFVADAAGNYAIICYIAGHTTLGMWLYFDVSGDGEAGVRGL